MVPISRRLFARKEILKFPRVFLCRSLWIEESIERSSELFDEVIVVLSHNVQKNYLFSLDERKSLVEEVIAHVPNSRVVAVSGGLTVEAAAQLGASVLVRGVRNATDFEYEATLASHNRVQNGEVETALRLLQSEPVPSSSTNLQIGTLPC